MARSCLTPSTLTSVMFCLVLLPGSFTLLADQDVVTDDGREVLLKEDGTWEFRSTDRYANTKDGNRVRLKADNTWEYMGNAPLTSKLQVRTTTLDINLQRVEIEIHREKRHKNVHITTQTVFYLKVSVTPMAKNNISLSNSDLSRIRVMDNKGNTYRVLSITPGQIDLAPDSEQTITIRAEGSPTIWSDARSMEVELLPGILGIHESITLSQHINDIEEISVKGFE